MAALKRAVGSFPSKFVFVKPISERVSKQKGIVAYISTNVDKKAKLWENYQRLKQRVDAQILPPDNNPTAVFANNELNLQDIDVYGFDYDYTLASYKKSVDYLLYNLGRDALVKTRKYPDDILKLNYTPGFALRGLHCDVKKGILLKIDAFHNVQLGTVYRGHQPVSDEEVLSLYKGPHVPIESMTTFYGMGPALFQLMDIFALPEMTLFSNVVDYFMEHNIPYDPEYVFYDVRTAVQGVHSSGVLHKSIMDNISFYLEKSEELKQLLEQLLASGKKIFLMTNSGFPFVNAGMEYMVDKNWIELFDVVLTNAKKPKFFNQNTRPFREYDPQSGTSSWHRIQEFKKGKVYQEGNIHQFGEITGWYGSRVLYFGDHVYSDLADVTLKHAWRTGGIIPELEDEIKISNKEKFKTSLRWLLALQKLIEESQNHGDPAVEEVIQEWLKERDQLRYITKTMQNTQFGSMFRTYHNPTFFSRRLSRYADVYTSTITNLLHYSTSHTFYPRRAALPHEMEVIVPFI